MASRRHNYEYEGGARVVVSGMDEWSAQQSRWTDDHQIAKDQERLKEPDEVWSSVECCLVIERLLNNKGAGGAGRGCD